MLLAKRAITRCEEAKGDIFKYSSIYSDATKKEKWF